jgi:hypothetical protein
MIIIPLDDNFEHKTSNEQSAIVIYKGCFKRLFSWYSRPVWLHGRQMKFIAPRPWHPFSNHSLGTVFFKT